MNSSGINSISGINTASNSSDSGTNTIVDSNNICSTKQNIIGENLDSITLDKNILNVSDSSINLNSINNIELSSTLFILSPHESEFHLILLINSDNKIIAFLNCILVLIL